MRARCLPIALVFCLQAEVALAQGSTFQGTRALGMGGALRAAATADHALILNPSGMPLQRSYVIGGSYQYGQRDGEHVAHASVADSTSAFNLAGGLYYTYVSASPESGPKRSGHEFGAALALPLAESVAIGGTAKYFRVEVEGGGLLAPAETRGFTFDAGITIRPVPALSVGVVGYNLRDLDDPRLPLAVGGGLALSLGEALLITADAVADLTRDDESRGAFWHLMAGGEYTMAGRLAVRGGGGRRGDTKTGYLAAGLSVFSEAGALDAGLQQDLGGARKETLIAVSARLFFPFATSE